MPPRKRVRSRPFLAARAFARALGLKNQHAWRAYCRSGQKPADIPSGPAAVYGPAWKTWDDWLGAETKTTKSPDFRPFTAARAFVHTLGLKTEMDWRRYSHSGQRPDDIPGIPRKVYAAEWRGVGDWLGTGTIAPKNPKFRPFAAARAFVHTLGLKSKTAWLAYCRSGQRPDDIPSYPVGFYDTEWCGFSDWLGTGIIAYKDREYRPFAAARAFVHTLGLKTEMDWRRYSRSGQRPDDIPGNPTRSGFYAAEWRGWPDWLGTFRGWNKNALLAFLESLRPHLSRLSHSELHTLLQQGGQGPALRASLGRVSLAAVVRDLKNNEATRDAQ